MPNRWQQTYTELTEYVTGHHEIEIGLFVVSIPERIRPEFYRLFDAVTATFLEERYPVWLNEAKAVSRSYLKAEQEVIKLLGVVDVTLPDNLHHFLYNPTKGLTRFFSHLLFDLLKGKSSFEAFEQGATEIIGSSFRDLYHSGYVKWLGLSLVRLLEADKTFYVASPVWEDDTDGEPNYQETGLAPPEESLHLRFGFGQQGHHRFIVPDFIVHSARIGRYVTVGSALSRAFWAAANASKKREWYPLDAVQKIYGPASLNPDLLLYIDERPEDIALVADAEKICRPDLIIECREQEDWYEKQGLTNVKRHHAALKPKLGTFIVSRKPVPEQVYKELSSGEVSKEGVPEQPSQDSVQGQASQQLEQIDRKQEKEAINIITAGLDQPNLEPIVEALINSKVETLRKR